uniref:WD_REPEATS_REGION domain-containing protein n=1 Tax=Macrostomum lignano TaxID=282301 RepID=A0A1I8IMD9_9PLAT
MSDDLKILSAAGDGKINLIDLGQASNDGGNVRSYACHRATVFDIVTSPTEADLFLSVSADGTLRQERLFVADKDGYIGEYDRRCIGYGRWVSQSKPVEVLSSKRLVRVTSLSFNPSATQLLASYNGGSLYLFDIKQTVPQSQLTAAPNAGCDPLHGGPLPTDAVPAEDSSASEQPMDQEGQNPPLPEDSDDTSDEVPAVRQRHSEPPTPAPSSEPHELSNSSSNGAGAASAASVASVPADSAATRAAPCQSNRRGLADSGSQVESATDYPSYPVCRVFQGHRNARTCIQQAAFWGSNYVLSGSDCGHFLVWRASDGRLLNACLADKRVVNRVAPHPSLLYLATSGIDYDVKLWSPIAGGEKSLTSANNDLAGLVKRNQAMLAQTMNTVTVPGSAMLSIMRTLSRLYSHDAQ